MLREKYSDADRPSPGDAPGYCKKCREMELQEHGTVLDYDLCEKLKIDYLVAHAECCEKAGCQHPFWY